MKNYIKFSVFAVMIAFASCSNNDAPDSELGPVKIIATISDDGARVNTEGNGDKFLANDTINVGWYFIDGQCFDAYKYTTLNGTVNGVAEFTPLNSKATWKEKISTFVAYTGSLLYCYYERYRLFLFNLSINGFEDQTTIENLRKNDAMVAEAFRVNYYDTDGVVPFNFVHAFCKVTVNFTEYVGFDGQTISDSDFEDVALYGFSGEYWFSMEENTPIEITDEAQLRPIYPYMTKDSSTGRYSFTAIIPPAAYPEGRAFLTFKLKGLDYKVLVDSNLCTPGYLESGKHYQFNVSVKKKSEITISKASIIDWNEVNFEKWDE